MCEIGECDCVYGCIVVVDCGVGDFFFGEVFDDVVDVGLEWVCGVEIFFC